MAEFEYDNITEAFRNLLRGDHTLIDPTRVNAQIEVRNICRDRIYSGRKPQGTTQGPWIDCVRISDDPQFTTTAGESSSSSSLVEVTVHAQDNATASRLAAACKLVLNLIRTTVECDESEDVKIGSCIHRDDGQQDPSKIPDASADYDFQVDLLFSVMHSRVTAVGFA